MQQTFKSLQGEFTLFIMFEHQQQKKQRKNARKRQYPTKEIFNKAHFLVIFIQSEPLFLVPS